MQKIPLPGFSEQFPLPILAFGFFYVVTGHSIVLLRCCIFAHLQILIGMSEERNLNFIEEIIEEDLNSGKHASIVTRFPPEPNGYLHIGHAKSICLNFGLSKRYGGYTNLRFDDTNPSTEETEYVDSIKEDVEWLGFHWKNEFYASDYFEQLYEFAIQLINNNLAYVDDSSAEEIAAMKGTPTEPGKE